MNSEGGCVSLIAAAFVAIVCVFIWRASDVDAAKTEQRCNDRGGVMTDKGCFEAGAVIRLPQAPRAP
jgi:hypothetical protein